MPSVPNLKTGELVDRPLAVYRHLSDYIPAFSDVIIWSGFFSTWIGIVKDYDSKTDELLIIFSTIPSVLFTLSPDEQDGHTHRVKLSRIRSSIKGTFAVQQHEPNKNTNVWYL